MKSENINLNTGDTGSDSSASVYAVLTPELSGGGEVHEGVDISTPSNKRYRLWSPFLQYLRDIEKPTESDRELIARLKQGDDAASFMLFCKHYPYILRKIMEITQGRWYSDDVLQAGALGLYEAANRFDASRENKFLTYAHYWILKYLYIEIRNELLPMGGIGIGRDGKERLFNFIKYTMEGLPEEEIKARLKVTSRTMLELKILSMAATRLRSLDKMVSAEYDDESLDPKNATGMPTHRSAEDEYLGSELLAYVERCVEELKDYDAQLSMYLKMTLGVCGQEKLDKEEIRAALRLERNELDSMRRRGNFYLRRRMLMDGWYETHQKDMMEAYTCLENKAKGKAPSNTSTKKAK